MLLSRLGRSALAAICLLSVAVALAGCAEGQSDETQPTEAPATEAPANTEAPAAEAPANTEAPATEAPPAAEAPDTDAAPTTAEDGNDNVGVALLLLFLGIVLAALIGALVGRRGNGGAQQPAPAAAPQRDLLANVRWLHDQLSVQVTAGPPETAAQQWATDRYRVQNMATAANQYSSGAGGGAWQRLSQAITDTATALDHSTAIRTDAQASATAVAQAGSMVDQNRAVLMQAAEVAARTVH